MDIGEAAHIKAASPRGPRFDASQTVEERISIANAIWLCRNHAKAVDSDESTFTVEQLLRLKAEHEQTISDEIVAQSAPLDSDISPTLSEALLSWTTTLPGGAYLERPEMGELLEALESEAPRNLLVIGVPGSGKSALFASLGAFLRERGMRVEALKVDQIPRSVNSRDELARWAGAKHPLDQIFRIAAKKQKTVLLIDQLDALCNLVDLQTERLDVVLDLIGRLSGTPRLHIVASCRAFELHHDNRFRRLRADLIQLELPSWSAVADVLRQAGVEPTGIPDRLRKILQVPQHLKVFLQLKSTGREGHTSYQLMLEDLWQEHVKPSPARRRLIDRLTEYMAREESLSAPLSLADDEPEALHGLQAAEILRRSGLVIVFAHQTLFDFARARLFSGEKQRLEEYVAEHQDGLFIRPILWSSLTYMKEARLSEYKKALNALLFGRDLRLHVRVLLAEFLGQVEVPDDDEVLTFMNFQGQMPLRRAALQAMVGSPVWFSRLRQTVLPSMVHGSLRDEVTGILIQAIDFASREVIELLFQNCIDSKEGRQFAFTVLRFITKWDRETLQLIYRLMPFSSPDDFSYSGILFAINANSPALAPEFIAAVISSKLNEVERDYPANGENSAYERQRKIEEALNFGKDVNLKSLAKNYSHDFLETLFPPLRKGLAALELHHSAINTYGAGTRLEFEDSLGSALVEAIEQAVIQLASTDPQDFLRFVSVAADVDAMIVHRALCRGFAALPEDNRVTAALKYLMGDPRRLSVAVGDADDAATVEMLAAISPLLSEAEVLALEGTILDAPYYRPGLQATPKLRLRRLQRGRAHRALLCSQLPREKLSTRSLPLLCSALPEPSAPRRNRFDLEMNEVTSPMSPQQMREARDEDILGLFGELDDSKDWSHRPFERMGGSIEASRAFGEFAKLEPVRAVALIRQFEPLRQENPVAHALGDLSEIGWNPQDWVELVLQLDERGFKGEEFRWWVARSVQSVAKSLNGASEPLCAMLERWLDEVPAAEDHEPENLSGAVQSRTSHKQDSEAEDEKPGEPIIFNSRFGGILPRGSYPTLHALFCAFMFRTPPATDRWLEVLEKQLPKRLPVKIWGPLSADFQHIRLATDPNRAKAFLRDLLRDCPALFESVWGAHLMAMTIDFVEANIRVDWVQSLRASPKAFSQQAAGELMTMASFRSVDMERPEDRLEGETSSFERMGIAFVAGEAWAEPLYRHRATGLLVQLLKDEELSIRLAALRAVNSEDVLEPDDDTRQVLETILADAELMGQVPDVLATRLGTFPSHWMALMNEFVGRYLDAVDGGIRDDKGWSMRVGPELVAMSLSLQRTQTYRIQGMDLFERLLQHGASGVEQALFDIDARLRRTQTSPPMRLFTPHPGRRRRRRK